MDGHPNIVFIMTDNESADTLGCYGNKEMHSPNLDQLAAEGIRFNNAFCANAMCSPGRASALTGLLPCQHGIHTWLDDRLVDQWPKNWNALEGISTLAEILGKNHYDTAMIGKYHLGIPFEAQNGFDHWVTFARGHTVSFYGNTMVENGKTHIYDEHSVDFFTDKAVEYINARATMDKPFFLYVPYNGPYGHWPAIKGPPDNRFAHVYEDTPMHSVPREGLSENTVKIYDLQKDLSGPGGPDFSSLLRIPNDLDSLRNYYSQMSIVDDGVGQIMDALDSNGLDNDTLVIFTADHGFSLGHRGFWGHGQATWPSNLHRVAYNIPMLLRHPGAIKDKQISDMHLSGVDLFSTILDYAGLDNMNVNPDIPSRSFTPLLQGEEEDWDDVVYFEQEESRGIRTKDWLLMKRFKGSETYPLNDELYDINSDPEERQNLGDDPEFSNIVENLSDRVETYFNRYADRKYDLWKGGTVKSNTSRPWLWRDAWGENWKPVT